MERNGRESNVKDYWICLEFEEDGSASNHNSTLRVFKIVFSYVWVLEQRLVV